MFVFFRNDMNLAVWEGEGRLRLYTYNYEDTFRERVGRFIHNGITQLWEDQALFDLEVVICGKVSDTGLAYMYTCTRACMHTHTHTHICVCVSVGIYIYTAGPNW